MFQVDASLTITDVPGFLAAGVAGGIKPEGSLDCSLIASLRPCSAAALFTTNKFPAAPVLYDGKILEANPNAIQAVMTNSGCANACTGVEGLANARRMAEVTEALLGLPANTCFVMSTGVIGVQLPMDWLEKGIRLAVEGLSDKGGPAAAQAIMTTDTRPKTGGVRVALGEATVTIAGMAKGAGMIHPNMATLLAVVVTDAPLDASILRPMLERVARRSFNSVTIDGDTSTNDTLLLLANHQAEAPNLSTDAEALSRFEEALTAVCVHLAQEIVRDGEGASKFVSIEVRGAASEADARRAAKAIAHSPLVKTAVYGGDANWGRILCAVGYSGADVDPERAALWFGSKSADLAPLQVVAAGQPLGYAEADASARFQQPELEIMVDLGLGDGHATVWTCDLSHEYVTINGHYRT